MHLFYNGDNYNGNVDSDDDDDEDNNYKIIIILIINDEPANLCIIISV